MWPQLVLCAVGAVAIWGIAYLAGYYGKPRGGDKTKLLMTLTFALMVVGAWIRIYARMRH
jgi:hypothetical protein